MDYFKNILNIVFIISLSLPSQAQDSSPLDREFMSQEQDLPADKMPNSDEGSAKIVGPLTRSLENLCAEREPKKEEPGDLKFDITKPQLGYMAGGSASRIQDFQKLSAEVWHTGISQKEEVARAVIINEFAIRALRTIYEKSGSSSQATQVVTDIMNKNRCDGSVVKKIAIERWKVRFRDGKFTSTEDSVGASELMVPLLLNSDKFASHDEYTQAVEKLARATNLNDEDVRFASELWASVGYTGQCAQASTEISNLCSGKINSITKFAEDLGNIDPQNASLGLMIRWGLKAFGIVSGLDYASDHVLKDVDSKMNDFKNEGQNLFDNKVKEIEALEKEIEKYEKKSQEYAKKKAEEGPFFEKKNQAGQDSAENEKKISERKLKEAKEVLEKIKKTYGVSSEKNPNRHDYRHFLENRWMPYLEDVTKNYAACVHGPNADIAFVLPNSGLSGETCDYKKAIQELRAVVSTQKPLWYADQTEDVFDNAVSKNIERARSGQPPQCSLQSSMATADVKNSCDSLTDDYYRSKGFEGGQAEFCSLVSCEQDWVVSPNQWPEGTPHAKSFEE